MNEKVRILTSGDLDQFLGERPFALVHLDAEWDLYRRIIGNKVEELANHLTDSTSFGYIDIDVDQEYARAIGLKNVPACSYYRGKDLVATVIGLQQDIERNLEIVRHGGMLGLEA